MNKEVMNKNENAEVYNLAYRNNNGFNAWYILYNAFYYLWY